MKGVRRTSRGGRKRSFSSFLFAVLPAFSFLLLSLHAQEPSGVGKKREDFADLFSRAVRALPPQEVRPSACGCSLGGSGEDRFRKTLALLEKAWRLPGAPEKTLDLLARDLEELSRVKKDLLRGKALRGKAGVLPPRFRLLLGRIQCAARMLQWELRKRAREESRPRPPSSPLTDFVSRILDLAFLSPEGGSLVHRLLSEKETPPSRRRFYLRGVHLARLEEVAGKEGEGGSGPPWRVALLAALRRTASANRRILERARRAGKGGRGAPRAGGRGIPLDWNSLAARWKRLGRSSPRDAYTARKEMVTSLLADGEDLELALRGADLFYRTYPGVCPLGIRGWANLAWKKGAVPEIIHWIRARWNEAVYRQGVRDALQGLWVGGGLVHRRDRLLVEDFMVETWRAGDIPPEIRIQALARIARSASLSSSLLGEVLEEARAFGRKGLGREEVETLRSALEELRRKAGRPEGGERGGLPRESGRKPGPRGAGRRRPSPR